MKSGNSRRRFLTTILGLGALVLSRPRQIFAVLDQPRTCKDPSLDAAFIQILRHQESAIHIGREYLKRAPREADPKTLLDFISPDLAPGDSCCAEADGLCSFLRLRMRRDFAQGSVIEIQGWILSLTEARLCALAALILQSKSS